MIKRKQIVYYFTEENVVMCYNRQYTSFNCYALQSRKKFKDFVRILQESKKSEYGDINSIFGLATRHGIVGVQGHPPRHVENPESLRTC